MKQSLIHLAAIASALCFAWMVSQTNLVRSGMQFVAPLLVILVVHTLAVMLTRGLRPGFSLVLLHRSCISAICMAFGVILFSIFAPQPASAGADSIVAGILLVVFCLVVLAVVVAIAAVAMIALVKVVIFIFERVTGGSKGSGTRLYDFGALAVTTVVLCVASLEGHPRAYSLPSALVSSSEVRVDAVEAQIWSALETATSPEFPLPALIRVFPRPTAVVTDEGVALGAMRRVRFEGREGEGYLTLRVDDRSERAAHFAVLSDTSPLANWINLRSLTYNVEDAGHESRLTVEIAFDRRLAPAWFFTPTMKGAVHLAANVLARDVKERAEAASDG